MGPWVLGTQEGTCAGGIVSRLPCTQEARQRGRDAARTWVLHNSAAGGDGRWRSAGPWSTLAPCASACTSTGFPQANLRFQSSLSAPCDHTVRTWPPANWEPRGPVLDRAASGLCGVTVRG